MQRVHSEKKPGSEQTEPGKEAEVGTDSSKILNPRAYQIEMLEESQKRNIIVAMDTGSGKTNIAILRIAAEFERCATQKLVWFLCPTITLAEQQHRVLTDQLPAYQSRLLSGNDGVDHWGEKAIWDGVLRNINIVVCTHQVLLDAMVHGYVQITDMALLVFDEAHHCAKKHAANRIMQEFYHPLRQRSPDRVPAILGLTASPVVKKKPNSLELIEQNLNAISKTPKLNRDELMKHANRPEMVVITYAAGGASPPSPLTDLSNLFNTLDIEQDPYLKTLREENHVKYLQVHTSRKTYCQEQLNRLLRMANEVNCELGPWASGLYIYLCICKFQSKKQSALQILENMKEEEKLYLQKVFDSLQLRPIDMETVLCDQDLSPKARELVAVLANEMQAKSAGIVFVKTRAAVKLLSIVLGNHPLTKNNLRIGTFVGTSNNQARTSSISDLINIDEQKETLNDLKDGTKNLIIATSVCEEGIDISACNIVVCFEKPPNLKSFIQRRGRARTMKSKYIIMLSEDEKETAFELAKLEAIMIEKYMDETREMIEPHILGDEEVHREFVIEHTGAKMTLDDALPHLHHFCNTLPSTPYAELDPVFIFEQCGASGKEISCRVILPNSVHSSLQEFQSATTWRTERLARKDAAFQAYIGLYHAGLINDHMLPCPKYDAETVKCLAEVARRPGMAEIEGNYNCWPLIAEAWNSSSRVFSSVLKIWSSGYMMQMRLISPCLLPAIPNFQLYKDAQTTLQVEIGEQVERGYDRTSISVANEITKLLLSSAFPKKTEKTRRGFPLLFLPLDILDDLQIWLDSMSGIYDLNDVLSGVIPPSEIGLIADCWENQYIFHGIEHALQSSSDAETPMETNVTFKVKKMPKRVDFLHKMSPGNLPPSKELRDLEPKDCKISRLSVSYSLFAMYIPSIMHRIENGLLTDHVCRGLFAPIAPLCRTNFFTALCSSVAREDTDYQRLEFLGDAILKLLTSITMMAEHPLWPEGYLSSAKNHIVSNGRLALAAQETGLSKYILTTAFTGKKWRPLYNAELLSAQPTSQREVSTKVLADVVEAVLGAAYLDGGFPKAFTCLRIFVPEVNWLPLAERNAALSPSSSPSGDHQNLGHLESIIGHRFVNKALLLEAITHPSHFSRPPTPSYQRLEFLGDAILDYLVTRTIWSHSASFSVSSPLSVPRMHLLRVAAVNASFLAFWALSNTIFVDIAAINRDSIPSRRENRSQIHSSPLSASTKPLSLPAFLRHAPSFFLTSALNDTRARFELLSPTIRAALDSHQTYPWRELAAFAPEKFVSDMVESVLGAVYIDTDGDFDACERVAREFGILGWVEQALNKGGKIWHPKEEMGVLAAKEGGVRYDFWVENAEVDTNSGDGDSDVAGTSSRNDRPNGGKVDNDRLDNMVLGKGKCRCRLFVGEREVCVVQGWNRMEVEIAAADEAMRILGEEKKIMAEDMERGMEIATEDDNEGEEE